MIIIFLTSLLFLPLTLMGQSIDVEKEKFPGVKKMTVHTKNYAQKVNYQNVYYFDNNGNAIKSSSFRKRRCFIKQRLNSYVYRYNDWGLLSEEIKTYDANNKREARTTKFTYEFDIIGRLTCKTIDFGYRKLDIHYQDFDKNNNPQTIIYPIIIVKKEYNSLNNVIIMKLFEDNAIRHIEEMQYNEFGDKIYSKLPLYNKEKIETMTSGRYSAIEVYEYIYDKSNRWIEKYVIFDNKKVLLQKRFYK